MRWLTIYDFVIACLHAEIRIASTSVESIPFPACRLYQSAVSPDHSETGGIGFGDYGSGKRSFPVGT